MAKKKSKTPVINLRDVDPVGESKLIYSMPSNSYSVNITIHKIKANSDAIYILDQGMYGEYDHWRIDYSDLKPQDGSKAIAIRNGNDLIFKAKIFNGSKITKTVTTTFRDYYLYSKPYVLHIDNKLASMYEYWYNNKSCYEWNGDELRYTYGMDRYNPYSYQEGYITDAAINRIAGSTKSDVYSLASGGSPDVFDEGGNDKYLVAKNTSADIKDFAGNDSYVADESSARVYDYAGNDSYTSYRDGSFTIDDYAGNDNYHTYNGYGDTEIYDYKGNDSYKGVVVADGYYAHDYAGNDKYDFTRAQVLEIEDFAGNDKYTISSSYPDTVSAEPESAPTRIYDKKGKDSYNLTDVDYVYIVDGTSGKNDSGNDTYNFNKVTATKNYSTVEDYSGNDKYNLTDSKDGYIYDYKGNDTFNIKNTANYEIYHNYAASKKNKYTISDFSKNIYMEVVGTSDTFNFSNSSNITVIKDSYFSSKTGKDKFTVTGCDDVDLYVNWSGATEYKITNTTRLVVEDYQGNDKYTLKSSQGAITDEKGNDTYTISSADNKITISDLDGKKDVLKLTTLKKENLIVTANIESQDGHTAIADGSVILLDKTADGYTIIDKFNTIGEIEKIVGAKNKNLTSYIKSEYNKYFTGEYNTLMANVADWLYNATDMSIAESLQKGNISSEYDNMKEFIALYTGETL